MLCYFIYSFSLWIFFMRNFPTQTISIRCCISLSRLQPNYHAEKNETLKWNHSNAMLYFRRIHSHSFFHTASVTWWLVLCLKHESTKYQIFKKTTYSMSWIYLRAAYGNRSYDSNYLIKIGVGSLLALYWFLLKHKLSFLFSFVYSN